MSKPLHTQVDDASNFPRVYHLHAGHAEGGATELGSQLARALEHIGQALCIFDSRGRISAHNRLLPELLELSEQSLIGRTLLDLNRMAALAAGMSARTADLREKAAPADQLALVQSRQGGETEHLFPNGRVLRALHKPMGDGSWVMTVEDVTERKRAETLAAHLVRHDALTGLPNRVQFIEALSLAIDQVRESGRRIALVSFDLDHFGEVNDAHGVEAGDAVLVGIAARARADGRVGELVARVGGDEFCVLKTMETEEELEEFVPRLLRTISAPTMVGGRPVAASARMGIAIYPNDAADGSRLMANAELALARAREEAVGAVCMYDPDYDEVARHRRDLVRDMIEGLERGEFHVAYQQQSSILDGEVIGHEALLRWRHPIRGAVGPEEFIPVAEQSGIIGRLGLWVLETACREALDADLPGRLAVNLSPFQLDDLDLAVDVARILRKTGFPASRLELEVTETAVVSNKARALRTLGALQAFGISIALDDFGTGYSSIETLRALRWDKLKLDRSLLTEVENSTQGRAIMRAVISLGQALGTTVLAEGVETDAQLRLLQEEGCDQVQGYLFGRPAPIGDLRPNGDAYVGEPRGMVR